MLFRALVLGYLRRNSLRAAATLLAVVLGTAVAYAIDLANATSVASFARSVDVIANRVNLQVFGIGPGFDERKLLAVERLDGVESASPVVEGEVVVGARHGVPQSGEILHVLGIDATRAALPVAFFAAQASSPTQFDLNAFINENGIVISSRIAQAYRLHIGSLLHATAGPHDVALRVMGIEPARGVGVDSSVVFADLATAQPLFSKIGRLSRIDLIVQNNRIGAVQKRLIAMLPGTRVLTPHVRADEIRRMLASFAMNLSALADVALLVGMYLIANAVSISVVQRRAQIATLRALGASSRSIFGVFAAEGAIYGVVGAAIGLVVGALLANLSVGAVQETVSTLYVGSHADHVAYSWTATVRAFLLGAGAAILASVLPAREAARTSPAFAMRTQGSYERDATRLVRRATPIGFAVLLFAWGLAKLPAIHGMPLFGYASGLMIILGATFCSPALVLSAAWLLGKCGIRGPAFSSALAFLRASPRRFATAVTSLAVAVGMAVAIALLVASFRTTVVSWTRDALGADLYIKTPGAVDASFQGYFSPHDVRLVRNVPGVAAVDTFRGIDIVIDGRSATLGATDFSSIQKRNKLRFLGHVDLAQLAQRMRGQDVAVISEPFATNFSRDVGQTVIVPSLHGPVELKIIAIYNDYSTAGGSLIVDRSTFARLYHDDGVDSIAVYARPGVPLALLRTRIERAVAPLRMDINTNRELRTFAIGIFDRTFAITSALYVIALTIAMLGVIGTLFALVTEKRVEIGLLRYLGMTRAQVRTSVLVQAAFVGVVAAGLGIAIGLALGALLVFVINRQSFGWLIEWHAPMSIFVQAFVMTLVAALLAALYPGILAARIRGTEVLRVE